MPKGIKVNNSGHGKCSKEEKAARIEEGATWLLENPDSKWTDFIKWAEKKWNIQRFMAGKYHKWSSEVVGNVYSENIEAARKKADASLKSMLRKAIEADDTKLALSIRQEINKINGLYTQKIQIDDTTEKPIFNTAPIKASEEDILE